MIKAAFKKKNGRLCAVKISGHAGYAQEGSDIVCAAVTSAFQMCANGITEIIGDKADVCAAGETARINLLQDCSKASEAFLNALLIHLNLLSEQYAEYLEISYMEE